MRPHCIHNIIYIYKYIRIDIGYIYIYKERERFYYNWIVRWGYTHIAYCIYRISLWSHWSQQISHHYLSPSGIFLAFNKYARLLTWKTSLWEEKGKPQITWWITTTNIQKVHDSMPKCWHKYPCLCRILEVFSFECLKLFGVALLDADA